MIKYIGIGLGGLIGVNIWALIYFLDIPTEVYTHGFIAALGLVGGIVMCEWVKRNE